MLQDLPLFPQQASSVARSVDLLYFFLIAVSAFFSILVSGLIVFFAVRYRRARVGSRATPVEGSLRLEIVWTVIPLALTMVMFLWGAVLYYDTARPPANAITFSVTGKQWMWRIQHPTGHREINDMHIPVNTPIALTMTSEDVIHSFFVPAFRTKQDVVPGRYSTTWFEATRVGEYELFCAEYCGTKHSQMIGTVHVMEPEAYERWLEGRIAEETPAQTGERLFSSLRCDTCHAAGSQQRGPVLAGQFGAEVALANGESVPFDAEYVRESILQPRARIAAGFEPLMPTYQGQVTEEDVLAITAFLKTLTITPEDL